MKSGSVVKSCLVALVVCIAGFIVFVHIVKLMMFGVIPGKRLPTVFDAEKWEVFSNTAYRFAYVKDTATKQRIEYGEDADFRDVLKSMGGKTVTPVSLSETNIHYVVGWSGGKGFPVVPVMLSESNLFFCIYDTWYSGGNAETFSQKINAKKQSVNNK